MFGKIKSEKEKKKRERQKKHCESTKEIIADIGKNALAIGL